MDDKYLVKVKEETSISLVKAEFILDQAKDRLKALNESNDRIKDKSYIIFGALLSLITALLVIFVNHYQPKNSISKQDWVVMLPILYLITIYFNICLEISKNLFTTSTFPLGNEPQKLFSEEMMRNDQVRFLIAVIKDYSNRIDSNKANNEFLSENLDKCLKRAQYPAVIALIFFIFLAVSLQVVG